MIKEVLIAILLWVDPSVKVVPATQTVQVVCPPLEAPEDVERADRAHAKNMRDLGKGSSGVIVDPWEVLSDSQREALERSTGAR